MPDGITEREGFFPSTTRVCPALAPPGSGPRSAPSRCEEVDNLPLALVAPLGPDHHGCGGAPLFAQVASDYAPGKRPQKWRSEYAGRFVCRVRWVSSPWMRASAGPGQARGYAYPGKEWRGTGRRHPPRAVGPHRRGPRGGRAGDLLAEPGDGPAQRRRRRSSPAGVGLRQHPPAGRRRDLGPRSPADQAIGFDHEDEAVTTPPEPLESSPEKPRRRRRSRAPPAPTRSSGPPCSQSPWCSAAARRRPASPTWRGWHPGRSRRHRVRNRDGRPRRLPSLRVGDGRRPRPDDASVLDAGSPPSCAARTSASSRQGPRPFRSRTPARRSAPVPQRGAPRSDRARGLAEAERVLVPGVACSWSGCHRPAPAATRDTG